MIASIEIATNFQSVLHPAGAHAKHILDLWHLTLAICTVVFVAVLTAFFIALSKGASRKDSQPNLHSLIEPEPKLFRSVAIAVALSVVLLFVLIGADFLTSRALANVPIKDAVQIELTGNQWWWSARYMDDDSSKIFSTANELHIPVGKPVIITLKANDVIHSFWAPNLHGKKDMIPGRTARIQLRADQAGEFRAQCAEFCGFEHTLMALPITAESNDRFLAWSDARRQSAPYPQDDKTKRGQEIFLHTTCATCHAIQGTDANAQFGPDLTHLASRPSLGAGSLPNDADHLAKWIADPGKFKPGVNMPSHNFSANDLDALVAYLETLK